MLSQTLLPDVKTGHPEFCGAPAPDTSDTLASSTQVEFFLVSCWHWSSGQVLVSPRALRTRKGPHPNLLPAAQVSHSPAWAEARRAGISGWLLASLASGLDSGANKIIAEPLTLKPPAFKNIIPPSLLPFLSEKYFQCIRNLFTYKTQYKLVTRKVELKRYINYKPQGF